MDVHDEPLVMTKGDLKLEVTAEEQNNKNRMFVMKENSMYIIVTVHLLEGFLSHECNRVLDSGVNLLSMWM